MPADLQPLLDEALRLHAAGQLARADAIYRQILVQQPSNPGVLHALGVLHTQQGKHDIAVALIQQAIAHARASNDRSSLLQAHANLGLVFQELGRIDDAIAACRAAIEIDPNHFGAYNNLGLALASRDRIDEAIENFEKSLALRPDNADAWNNLANAYVDLLDTDRAMKCYQRAIYFRPDFADAHWNRSLVRLLLGDLDNGWREYQWRWIRFPDERRNFSQPLWDGFDIAGKTILLHAEQGFGDAIQFIRFAPLVAARGATVLVECQPATASLLNTVTGVSRVIPRGEPLPAFDVHCPLMNVAYAAGTRSIESIPGMTQPYLEPNAELLRKWRSKVESHAPDMKRIGLAWSGSAKHHQDRHRSVTLDRLDPLLDTPGVRFFSLQVDRSEPHARIVDLTADIQDFADSAALVANLDLVITVDTAAAHLAGALARPVWILLPYAPDWRWLLGREDSPWYPTARLFRQTTRGDWDNVIARVATELSKF